MELKILKMAYLDEQDAEARAIIRAGYLRLLLLMREEVA